MYGLLICLGTKIFKSREIVNPAGRRATVGNFKPELTIFTKLYSLLLCATRTVWHWAILKPN